MLVVQLLCSVLQYSSVKNGQVICVNFLSTRSAKPTTVLSSGMCKSKIQEWFLNVVSVWKETTGILLFPDFEKGALFSFSKFLWFIVSMHLSKRNVTRPDLAKWQLQEWKAFFGIARYYLFKKVCSLSTLEEISPTTVNHLSSVSILCMRMLWLCNQRQYLNNFPYCQLHSSLWE